MLHRITVLAIGVALLGCELTTDPTLDTSSLSTPGRPPIGVAAGPGGLTVMTLNLYIGTDVSKVLSAPSQAEIPVRAAEAFQTLVATNFPERAQTLAELIEQSRPHVIGLQEATLIRLQSPGDAIGGGTTPAEDVFQDYLAILLDALESRGLDYRVAAIVQNADIELPMVASLDPLSFSDIRVTDFGVLLVRDDVATANPLSVNYVVGLPLPPPINSLLRGFTAVDASVSGRTYRVVTTHLEVFNPTVQAAQAQQLMNTLAGESLPIVLLGDCNSPAPAGDTYQFLLNAGFSDVWSVATPPKQNGGNTCCQAENLRNSTSLLDDRRDLILFRSPNEQHGRGSLGAAFVDVIGEEEGDKTPSGLWPSDHAGVVASMRIPAAAHRQLALKDAMH